MCGHHDLSMEVDMEAGMEQANEDLTVETLIEDVSIDGMCGVY